MQPPSGAFATRCFRYFRAYSLLDVRRFLILRGIAPIGVLLAALIGRRRPRTTLACGIVATAVGASAIRRPPKLLRRGYVARREDLVGVDERARVLDFSARNPRWARRCAAARRPEEGYEPKWCVDGTNQLLSRDSIYFESGPATVSPAGPEGLDIWVMTFATYHIEELGPVLVKLQSENLSVGFVFASPPSRAQRDAAGRYSRTVYCVDEHFTRAPAVILTMVDWAAAAPITRRARRMGTRVLTKVEGAQDFKSVDSPSLTRLYSNTTCVLAQGKYDLLNAAAESVEIVGSVRLEVVLETAARGITEHVTRGPLVNLNFGYSVQGVWARPWYLLAERGVRNSGLSGVHSSVHPAQIATYANKVSPWPLALELEISSHLISRRSAAIFDALLLGRPTIYFNPHREPSWRNVPWCEAVPEVRSASGLSRALKSMDPADDKQTSARRAFMLDEFLSVDPSSAAVDRTARAVMTFL